MTQPSPYSRISQSIARRVRAPFVLSGFTGLNDDQNNQTLLDTDLRIATNIVNFRAALIGSRPGSHRDPYGAALNAGAAITGLYDFHAVKDSVQRCITIAGNKIYDENPAADPSTPTDITGACSVTPGATNLFTAASFRDRLILTNGVDVPIAVPSAGNAVPLATWFPNARKAQFVHSQFNYLFFGGFDSSGSPGPNQHPMSVQYSELGDDSMWLDPNFIDKIGGIGSYGDEYVTALFRHRDFLMIGTNRRIFPVQYTGNPLAKFIVQRALDVGVAGQNAVISINGEYTLFMSPRGEIHTVHEVANGFGAIGIQSLSRKIRNYVSNLGRQSLRFVHSAYLHDLGWAIWSVPFGIGATDKNELLVLDINDFPLDSPDWRIAKFFRWSGISANVLAVILRDTDSVANASEPSPRGLESLFFGTTSGWQKRFSEQISYDETDAGAKTPISTELATKYFDFGDPSGRKSIVETLWNMSPASTSPGPDARIEYDFGASRSRTRKIRMDSNLSGADLLGTTFILGQSMLASEAGITTSKDFFRGDGLVGSVRIGQSVSDVVKWRMQRLTMLVELRGEVPEAVQTS